VDRRLALVVLALLASALLFAACGGGDNDNKVSGVQAVENAECGDVQYSGSGEPSKLIVSDLPLGGDSAERSDQQNKAIVQELANRGWQAGQGIQVAFQACDDTIESTGEWDETKCKSNAHAYAANPDVIGVIGTYNSGCAKLEIPILNKASGGGIPMVSPGNTLVCLTETSQICKPAQPKSFYPSGTQNYVRVVPNDAAQGAGMAQFAYDQGVRKPFVLIAADDQTSAGQGRNFEAAARSLGMQTAGIEHYDPDAKNYTDLMQKAKAAGADAIFMGAILEENGAQVIKDKVAVLGPNDQAGTASAGMFASAPGREPSELTGKGDAFVKELKAQIGDKPVETFAPYAGEAADVLLDAIRKGKDRAGTIAELFKTNIKDGIIGSFSITPTGDLTPSPISVSKAAATFELEQTVIPTPELVTAARGQ
jgi:branched-chain amino acid transport system substrate-binding protein